MTIPRFYPAIIALTIISFCVTVRAQEVWQDVARIVAVGDLHGDYEQYLNVLRSNHLIDSKLKWQGGAAHLVQLGDVPDRGPDSLKIMRHLKRLQKQAKKAGGRVHALIGNHELMNIKEDLRYVHPGEFEILVNNESRRTQLDYIDRVYNFLLSQDETISERREEVMQSLDTRFPPGFVEHRLTWAPRGEVFEWLRRNNTVVKINRMLFVHGGISPHEELLPLKQINKKIRKIISSGPEYIEDPIIRDEGPLWYRGYTRNDAVIELQPLKEMLAFYDVDTIVVAHTPTVGAIMPKFDGRVIFIDVGLAAHYGNRLANLVVENNAVFAMHRGHKIALPKTDDGLLDYLLTVSKLDPEPSPLLETITKLESQENRNVGTD
ncbi:MAG: metallophosphoesterase [bacterium]|nr:protein-tyrosine-phosphatase [Gammaproteobacteria bacterium]